MLNKMMKGLVDLIYMTGRVRRKFELDNPNEKVLAADASKGIVAEKIKSPVIKPGLRENYILIS